MIFLYILKIFFTMLHEQIFLKYWLILYIFRISLCVTSPLSMNIKSLIRKLLVSINQSFSGYLIYFYYNFFDRTKEANMYEIMELEQKQHVRKFFHKSLLDSAYIWSRARLAINIKQKYFWFLRKDKQGIKLF